MKWSWRKDPHGYAVRGSSKDGHTKVHKEVFERAGKVLKQGEEIDHDNGDPLDNRRDNLRPLTHSQNILKAKIPLHNTSGVKGVTFNKQRQQWMAYISIRGLKHHLGFFDDFEKAKAARKAAEKRCGL